MEGVQTISHRSSWSLTSNDQGRGRRVWVSWYWQPSVLSWVKDVLFQNDSGPVGWRAHTTTTRMKRLHGCWSWSALSGWTGMWCCPSNNQITRMREGHSLHTPAYNENDLSDSPFWRVRRCGPCVRGVWRSPQCVGWKTNPAVYVYTTPYLQNRVKR